MWKEFKPAISFVLWFVGLYFVCNTTYGIYISYYKIIPDPMTALVADQTTWLLNNFGYEVKAIENTVRPTVFLKSNGVTVLNIFEGCNGINVFIVFASFLVAFGGSRKKLLWFLPTGIVIIYLANLLRLVLLYWTAIGYQRYFYYVHKYIFTAAIYGVVFILWIVWVNKLNGRKKIESA